MLYVAGSGRSGSTILDQILGQLDGFFSGGELVNLWERGLVVGRRCACGVPVDACQVWRAILTTGFGDRSRLDARQMVALGRHRVRARDVRQVLVDRARGRDWSTDEYRKMLLRLYQAIQQATNCRVIVDSSKSAVYAELLASIPGIDLYVVHLLRDPRATAYSWLRRKELPDFGDDRLMQRQAPLTSARRWVAWQAATEALWWRRPDRYLRLRYEDFVHEPQAAVRKIAGLVGEAPATLPFTAPTTVRLRPTHSVSGNPSRFATGVVQLRADDEWVGAMRGVDRALVTALTWPWLLRYHYPVFPEAHIAPTRRRSR